MLLILWQPTATEYGPGKKGGKACARERASARAGKTAKAVGSEWRLVSGESCVACGLVGCGLVQQRNAREVT